MMTYLTTSQNWTKIPLNVTFQISCMKLPELLCIIKSLDTNKATGLDGISAKLLKSAAHVISPSLLEIINVSISTGIFPDALKLAKLIPPHKGGAKGDPANYRPTSILSVLSKIIEKHVTKHLLAYMNKYKILHTSQSGFHKNHSCNTALKSHFIPNHFYMTKKFFFRFKEWALPTFDGICKHSHLKRLFWSKILGYTIIFA